METRGQHIVVGSLSGLASDLEEAEQLDEDGGEALVVRPGHVLEVLVGHGQGQAPTPPPP